MAAPALTPAQEALAATRFSAWYPRLRKVSPAATVLDVSALEPRFLSWLEADTIILPRGSGPSAATGSDSGSGSDSEDDDGEVYEFPALDAAIRSTVDKYDGAVFPKLNWSAPLDAAWILPGSSLRCTTPEDVYLVLKSSDFVTKDVEQAAQLGPAPESKPKLELVLKRWFDMPRSHEFRVFVRSRRIIAIAQRDVTFYEHLQPEQQLATIRERISAFQAEHMDPKTDIDDYIWDAYLTRTMDRVFLVDINPYLPRTDPILFDWEELDHLASATQQPQQPELRLVTSHAQASQALPTYSANMVPRDVVDISSGQNIAQFAKEWSDQLAAATEHEHDDDERQ